MSPVVQLRAVTLSVVLYFFKTCTSSVVVFVKIFFYFYYINDINDNLLEGETTSNVQIGSSGSQFGREH